MISGVEMTWPEFLDAMERKGSAETLANPHLMTLNGENAKLLIGQRIPVKMENSEGETSIKYIEAGITLEFRPWITEDGLVELDIRPKVSSLGEELYEGFPAIKTREVETRLRLKDGETFAIGGLIQTDKSESISRVPVLSSIPILGELFKQRNQETNKTELMIFITPRIVEQNYPEDKEDKSLDESEKQKDNQKNVNMKREGALGFSSLNKKEIEKVLNESRKMRNYNDEDNLPSSLNIIYTVKKAECIEDIADFYGISVNSIKFVNNINGDIKTGQMLTLPIPANHLYRLQKGETLWKLSQMFDVEVERLEDINNIADITNIPAGIVIIVPKEIR